MMKINQDLPQPRATTQHPRQTAAAMAVAAMFYVGTAHSVTLKDFGLTDNPALSEQEDLYDLVFTESWDKGKPLAVDIAKVGKRYIEEPKLKQVKETAPNSPSRIHPLIARWLSERKPDEVVEVIISKPENLVIPRFPEPDVTLERSASVNQLALKNSAQLVEGITVARAEANKALGAELGRLGGKMTGSYWLVPAVKATLPLSAIKALLGNAAISYIEPANGNELPPANANPNDDVNDARALLQSDPYFNAGLTSGWIGLLDSGVHKSHTLLATPNRIALWRDCTSGDANCLGGNPDDSCWNHGTSAAGIISGNSNQGNPQRGVTGIQIDSWKVYPHTVSDGHCTGGLNADATVRAFQLAVSWLDRIIVAEMQGGGSESSAISVAADAAFDAGSAVIAANGNNGPGGSTVNSPANAHKALGIGAFDTESGNQYGNQSRGPTSDGRFKPDVQTPNNSETASTGCGFGSPCAPLSNTANRVFGGTSGAVPFGGASAALARNWMRLFGQIDPGHVYARMILSGQDPYPFDNTVGAGRVKLPINGHSWWGKVSVGHHEAIEIPLNVAQINANNLDGALWWPEGLIGHNDIDVSIISPSGATISSSVSINSVFERARAAGTLTTGIWKLRIYGYSVTGRQTVYYGATVRN